VAEPAVDPQTMERLAFIRLLYQQGIEQSRQPEPLNVTSVLSLHDASELFLGLAADKLGASLPRFVPFMDYWKLLSPDKLSGGVELPARQRMDRLNELRNGLKHRGTLPSAASVDLACADVGSFLEDSTVLVFGVAFAAVDMAEIIPQAQARETVKAATAAELAGDREEAMGKLAEAFDQLIGGQPSPGLSRRRFGTFGPTISPRLRKDEIISILARPDGGRRGPVGGASRLAEEITQVITAGQAMQTALRMMALGLDYRRFDRFQLLTPRIMYYIDGHSDRRFPPGYAPSGAEFDYCRQFIITVALRMAELEAHTALPSWREP